MTRSWRNRDTLRLNPDQPDAVPVDTSARAGAFLTDTTANLVWFDLLAGPGAAKAGRDGAQGEPRCAGRHRHDQ